MSDDEEVDAFAALEQSAAASSDFETVDMREPPAARAALPPASFALLERRAFDLPADVRQRQLRAGVSAALCAHCVERQLRCSVRSAVQRVRLRMRSGGSRDGD